MKPQNIEFLSILGFLVSIYINVAKYVQNREYLVLVISGTPYLAGRLLHVMKMLFVLFSIRTLEM